MMKRDQPCNICHKQSKYITDNLLSNISDQLLRPAAPPLLGHPSARESEGKGEMQRTDATEDIARPRGLPGTHLGGAGHRGPP